MKTLNYFLLGLFSICLVAACDVTEAGEEFQDKQVLKNFEQEINPRKRFYRTPRAVPFKAKFFTVINDTEVGPNSDECPTPPFIFFNVQEGSGYATHLGNFTTRITFCVDITDLLDDGTLSGEESAPYNNGKGILTAANGDELHFTISGAVLPSDHPDYDFEFQDPFTFTGGTGRFAGAAGEGMTDSFVVQATDKTDHNWNGKISLSN